MNYECHITLPLSQKELGAQVAKELHWKTSEIERDPVLGANSYFYLTSHHSDIEMMFRRMRSAVRVIRDRGGEVLREKIELIIYDTK